MSLGIKQGFKNFFILQNKYFIHLNNTKIIIHNNYNFFSLLLYKYIICMQSTSCQLCYVLMSSCVTLSEISSFKHCRCFIVEFIETLYITDDI